MSQHPTKEKILTSARQLFIENGFSGTSVSKIAANAKVNHSLIFHHFENKEKLWCAVKESIVKDVNNQSKMLPSQDLPFKVFLVELIENSINFYQKNPDIIRMINWQRLEYASDNRIGINLSNETQSWLEAFKYYQDKKEINSSLQIEFIITLILAVVSSAILDQNTFIETQEDLKAYTNFCVERLYIALKY